MFVFPPCCADWLLHGAFSSIKMSRHPAQVYLSSRFVRWHAPAFRVGEMTTSVLLFSQLKTPSLSWSSLPSWSPTSAPAVGNVGWRRQRLQKEVHIKNLLEHWGSDNPYTEGHIASEECQNNGEKKKHPSLDVQVGSQAPARTHFLNSNACLFTPMSSESVYLILVKFVSIIPLSLLVQ